MNVSSEYAQYGTKVTGPPERKERDFAGERRADKWPLSTMLKETGLSPDDFSIAAGYPGFPKPIGRAIKGWGAAGDFEPIYSKRQYAAWRETFKAFAARVK
jgi:hypothetical protein